MNEGLFLPQYFLFFNVLIIEDAFGLCISQKHPQTVVFYPYNHEQLKKTLTVTVDIPINITAALQLMARRIASTSEAACVIFEMAIKHIDYCHESNSKADRKAIVVPQKVL